MDRNSKKKLENKNIEDIWALTAMQEGMLFQYLNDPQSDYYFEQLILEMVGDIKTELFEKAWDYTIQSHDMLRAIFRWEKLENPVHIILRAPIIKPIFYNFSDEVPENVKFRLEDVAVEDRKKKFDLREIPFRVILCRLPHHRWQMIISSHHILYDGWSHGIILRDFFQIYNDLLEGKQWRRPTQPKFKEFIGWLQKNELEKIVVHEAFWRRYLMSYDTVTTLPVKKTKRKAVGLAREYRIVWGDALSRRVNDCISKNRITLAAFLYGAWGILLQKYTNSADVVFGFTHSGRSAEIPGIENMVGMFINTLPLRARGVGNTAKNIEENIEARIHNTVKDLLSQIDEGLKEIAEHANVPLTRIKECSEVSQQEELFDNILVVENYPLSKQIGGENSPIRVESYSMVEMTHYDLTVIITVDGGISITFSYNQELFEPQAIVDLSRHYTGISQAIIENTAGSIAYLEWVSQEEKERVLRAWNNTETPFPTDKLLSQLFEDQVRRVPWHTAVVHRSSGEGLSLAPPNEHLTYAELNQRANHLAGLLRQKGVKPETRVGIMVHRSLEMVLGIMAILKAGGAYLPISPALPSDRIGFMLEDSQALLVLVHGDAVASMAGKYPILDLEFSAKDVTNMGDPDYAGSRPNDLAYVIYTSGSTGLPKGVQVEHSPVVNLLFELQKAYPLYERDTYLLKTAYMFDVSVTELFGWYIGGGRLAILGKDGEKNPVQILDTIEMMGVTHINFVPSMFNAFVDTLEPKNIGQLAGLKYVFLAGEALWPELIEKFKRLQTKILLENIYGPTEGIVYSCRYSLSQWVNGGNIPIGKPLGNIKLYILDKYQHVQPTGIPGELCIGGVGVARGYLGREMLTTERFIPDPFNPGKRLYRTGDLARWRADGNIEFLGRMDSQVKVRGFRIEMGEIENQLQAHPSVKDVVVAACEVENGEKYLCAYIVPAHPADKVEYLVLKEFLAHSLPDYMIPSFFVTLEFLPLTSSGKIDRRMLPAPQLEDSTETTRPRNEREVLLVKIWSEILRKDEDSIGIDDNFTQLGGHSLKSIALVHKIQRNFNVEIPMSKIFEAPTIRNISTLINQTETSTLRSPEPVEKREYYPLSSAQMRLFALQTANIDSTAYLMPQLLELEGNIDMDRFEDSLRKLVHRHESLRTSFMTVNGIPVQKIHAPGQIKFKMDIFDLSTTPLSFEDIQVGFFKPFDLSLAPLLRAGLVKLRNEHYIFMFLMHHIISDGVSMMIFKNEFGLFYTAQEAPLLALQYKDYAMWERWEKVGPRYRQQEEYWSGLFQGETPVLQLPTDYKRTASLGAEANTEKFAISDRATMALKNLALAEGASLYMILLAIFNVFLWKICHQEDIIVGTTITTRKHINMEPMIGLFVNLLPMKSRLSGESSFREFLATVKYTTLNAFENQDYQFDDLVNKVASVRDMSRNPIFDVLFQLESENLLEVDLTGVKVHPYREKRINSTKYDLLLLAQEWGETLAFELEYNTSLFKRDTITMYTRYFNNIISLVIENPGIPLSYIEITSDEKKKSLRDAFTDDLENE